MHTACQRYKWADQAAIVDVAHAGIPCGFHRRNGGFLGGGKCEWRGNLTALDATGFTARMPVEVHFVYTLQRSKIVISRAINELRAKSNGNFVIHPRCDRAGWHMF